MNDTRLKRNSIVIDKIKRDNGNSKSTCVSAVLTAIGIPLDAFKNTWNARTSKNVWAGIIRRNGFSLRSRKSQFKKGASVGGIRKEIQKLNDQEGTVYLVHVDCHILLVNAMGETIIDTDPRKRDKRRVLGIYAVWAK